VQIGVAANFTDPLSLPIRYGAQLAAEEINAAGGINGRPIELVEREDYADADSAVVVATDFYNSRWSQSSATAFPDPPWRRPGLQRRQQSSSRSRLPPPPRGDDAGPVHLSLCPSDLAHGSALAHWARERLG
jgi:hypothetical protein